MLIEKSRKSIGWLGSQRSPQQSRTRALFKRLNTQILSSRSHILMLLHTGEGDNQ
jgi:hypothetical protein